MKNKLSQLTQWLLTTVIALLGFSACDDKTDPLDYPLMYGTPTADYKAEGIVTDEDGNHIKGIQIKAEMKSVLTGDLDSQIVYSDDSGKYATEKHYEKKLLTLTATDIDGEENGGEFEEKVINLQEMIPLWDKTDADGWYIGVYNYVVNFKLTKKSADNE